LCLVGSDAVGHFRMPSIDQGVIAVLWGLGLGVYVYFGLLAIGWDHATSFVLAAVSASAIALFVRLRGAER
jgi:hypothetical protein